VRVTVEGTADLAEWTEALRRDFLFRGFFRDRGVFDLDSVSRQAHLGGAIEGNRTRVRIWIDANVLFASAVREDPLSRFRRQASLTDTMPMGADAPQSPSPDNRWSSGATLALLVKNDLFGGSEASGPAGTR
jgi:hypothetical protein